MDGWRGGNHQSLLLVTEDSSAIHGGDRVLHTICGFSHGFMSWVLRSDHFRAKARGFSGMHDFSALKDGVRWEAGFLRHDWQFPS